VLRTTTGILRIIAWISDDPSQVQQHSRPSCGTALCVCGISLTPTCRPDTRP
jgi:hypothetical protein